MKPKSSVYKKLLKEAPILKKAMERKQINFLTLEYPKKTEKAWKQYQTKTNSQRKLKKHNGNIGIILGFNKENQDYYLAGVDIDGFNINEDELKQSNKLIDNEKEILSNLTPQEKEKYRLKTRQDLYELLKDMPNVWKDKTGNQGYHILYWTTRDFENKFIENIYYPIDYPIEILRNKPITYLNKHIENYTYGRQFVAPFSEIEQEDGTKSYYKFVSTPEEIIDFFENPKPKDNVLNDIKSLVEKNKLGFTYKEPETHETVTTAKLNKEPTKESNNINISTGTVKAKIYNQDIRKNLLKNIVKAGYVQGNMNNLGYILICNFRRHGLNKKEVFSIFKALKVKNHDLSKVKSWINDKFKVNLNSVENRKYAGLNALIKEIKALANDNGLLNLITFFQDFFYDVISELRKKPESRNALVKLAEFVEAEYNIFKTLNKKKPIYYHFNDETNTYKEITHHELGIKLFNDYGLRLPDTKYNIVLTSCQRVKEVQNDFVEMDNVYINTKAFEILSKKDNDILTSKKFYIETNESEKYFLSYDSNVNLINNGNDETLTEKTLKEILVPKNDPDNLDYYIDYLQRLGACILLNHKIITGYLGGGYNGKSILNWYCYTLFNDMYSGIEPEDFKKEHNIKAFERKHIVTIDELDDNSFNGIIPDVKRFRGGGVPISKRIMYQ
jgi:hypothetical protein